MPAETDYTEPCDYMAQTAKYGGQARQSGISYDGARHQAQQVIDRWEQDIKDLDTLKAEARAASSKHHSFNTPDVGVTVVGTLKDANPDFFRFLSAAEEKILEPEPEEEKEPEDQDLEDAMGAYDYHREDLLADLETTRDVFVKDKDDDYYKDLQSIAPMYEGFDIDPPLVRLEKSQKLMDKTIAFSETETTDKLAQAAATESERNNVQNMIDQADDLIKNYGKGWSAACDEHEAKGKKVKESPDGTDLPLLVALEDEALRSFYWSADRAVAALKAVSLTLRCWLAYYEVAAKPKPQQTKPIEVKVPQTPVFKVLALDTKIEWSFTIEVSRPEEPVEPTPGIFLRGDYLSDKIESETWVLGRDRFRPTTVALWIYADGVLDGLDYFAHKVKATSKVLESLSDYLLSGYGTFMLMQPEWRERLGEDRTLSGASWWIQARRDSPPRYEAFMRDAMAWRKRELVRDAFYKEKKSPLYRSPTGNVRDGGNFGAESLATADGFIGTVMEQCLDSGDTMTGFIHTFAKHKFAYTLTPSTWSSSDVSPYMDKVSNEASKIQLWDRVKGRPIWVLPFPPDAPPPDEDAKFERTGAVSKWFVKTSYARNDGGEPIQRQGHCKLVILFKGESDMKKEDFDQFDKFKGKDLMPVKYRAKAYGAIA